MASMTIPLPSFNETGGSLHASLKSDPEGTDVFADWLGAFADGEETVVDVLEVRILGTNPNSVDDNGGMEDKEDGRNGFEWLVGSWRFEVVVPGASEDLRSMIERGLNANIRIE
jgi:hypothetical protein